MKTLFFLVLSLFSFIANAGSKLVDKVFSEPDYYTEVESGITLNESLDLSVLNESLGEYCKDPANKDMILSNMFLSWNPERYFTVVEQVDDEMPIPIVDVESFLKPNNDAEFEPTAEAIKFSSEVLKTHRFKGDLSIVPGGFHGTWLAKYRKKKGAAYSEHDAITEIVFEEYLMDLITKKAGEDIRLKAAFKGVRNAAGTTPADITNGVDTIIKAKRSAGDIVPVSTGAVTTSNIVDKLYVVHSALNEAVKEVQTQCILPANLFDAAAKQIRTGQPNLVITSNEQYLQQRFATEVMLPETNVVLKRESGRGTTQMLYITQIENLFMVLDRRNDYTNITTEKRNRKIELMIDGRVGFNVGKVTGGMFACNEQN